MHFQENQATKLALNISQNALRCKTFYAKSQAFKKVKCWSRYLAHKLSNFCAKFRSKKCISLFTIRKIYYLRIQRRNNPGVKCLYFMVIKTNRIIWTSLVGAGGQRLNAGSSWGHSGCVLTESAASQTWPTTEDSFKFIPRIRIRIQGLPIRICIWRISNIA